MNLGSIQVSESRAILLFGFNLYHFLFTERIDICNLVSDALRAQLIKF